MTTIPKVTRLILFKHGVACLDRRGPADASFDLDFPLADMNDVLKSLTVAIPDSTARVMSIGYDAPRDPQDELARRNLLFEPGTALIGLLAAAQGREVELTGAGGEVVRGEVIGVDTTHSEQGERRLLAIRSDGGRVEVVDLAEVRAMAALDGQLRDDLAYLVDRSRATTMRQNRLVTIDLTGPVDDMHVSYVVLAPVWRVSYRLSCQDDGTITIVAMGIVQNPVDEDLEDIELTLTTGRPATFDVDLFSERRMQRVMLDEVGSIAQPPTQFEQSLNEQVFAAVDAAPPPRPAAAAGYGAAPVARKMAASMAGAAVAEERGEYFEYRVADPVSLKRGAAAMVPLLATSLAGARRERIWRAGAAPAPEMVVAFENTTDAVLETGPVVIYDDGGYAGEAMLPFTTRGETVRLAFGTDLSVHCRQSTRYVTVTTGVRIGESLIEEQRQETRHSVAVANNGDADVEVIVELPKIAGGAIRTGAGLLTPFESTESFRRFRVSAPARGQTVVDIVEYTLGSRSAAYTDLSRDDLRRWLETKVLDEATFDELSEVMAHLDRAAELLRQAEQLADERTTSISDQANLTEQLKVLRHEGPEGDVRAATVAELVALRTRVDAIDEEVDSLRRASAAANEDADAAVVRLVSSAESR